jgi:putative ABC transport system permease protein
MITNYFILAFRHLKKQFLYFLINLLGLGIALGACFLLLLYTINEFSYDRYHPSVDQTYLLLTRELSKKEYDSFFINPFNFRLQIWNNPTNRILCLLIGKCSNFSISA